MAPTKRKAGTGEPTKWPIKQRKLTPARSPELSTSREEEPMFRRGGASVLTPLEQKQIQIRAKQDAFYEQETGKRLAATFDSDADEGINGGMVKDIRSNVRSKGRKPASKELKRFKGPTSPDHGIKIESLSYTRLAPGSTVLGQISKIGRYDIALTLPNNLTGYVPLTSISDVVTKELEASLDGSSSESEEEPNGRRLKGNKIDLHSFFVVGQYLRAYVVSTHDSAGTRVDSKRHIELSINPQKANTALTINDLVVNGTLQAEVLSVEDHGLIMNLGIESNGMKAFMSSRELGSFKTFANVRPGTVLLCLILGFSPSGNIVKLSADIQRMGNMRKSNYLIDAPSVNIFLPGTAVEVLITKSSSFGLTGKIMGLIDATSDSIHSGAAVKRESLEKQHHVGSKVKARIICTFHSAEQKKLGVSLLSHVLTLSAQTLVSSGDSLKPTDVLPLSTILDEVEIKQVEPGHGLFVETGRKCLQGFVHISRLEDGKVKSLYADSGPYKIGSLHRGRVIGYNSIDNLFLLSFEASVLDSPFLSFEDIQVGQVVAGVVERILLSSGSVTGILVRLAANIIGFVPEMHLADIQLQHPERKFKEGSKVRARVLSLDSEERQMRLTLKKSLINSDAPVWKSFEDVAVGMEAPGTLVSIIKAGAILQFYGAVKGFLPVSQMSESYIQDPQQHFHVGQVIKVHVLFVSAAQRRLTVSCIDESLFGPMQEQALERLPLGTTVLGNVCAKTATEFLVELEQSGLKASLLFEHLEDGSAQKCLSAAKGIRVGQPLQRLAVLSKNLPKKSIELTSKLSLIKALQSGAMPKSFEDVEAGAEVTGYVKDITSAGIFVRFAGYLTGLLPATQLVGDIKRSPYFGYHLNETISARVMSVDFEQQRFLLSRKDPLPETKTNEDFSQVTKPENSLVNPADGISTSMSDFVLGKLTRARIVSVKETQLNVNLADGVQGRVDVSAVFDTWQNIKDRKHPLKIFTTKQTLPVRILGLHDSRNHRYLPITNRGKAPVFELTAKAKDLTDSEMKVLTLDKVEMDSTWLCFVNNIVDDCLWVNLSPSVRGRISILNASDSAALLSDLPKNFPIGSALRARVISVDLMNNRLDLSARSSPQSLEDLSKGMIIPARITKVTERQIMVQLSDTISAPVHSVDMEDDFSKTDLSVNQKNQIISVCVVDIDVMNKKITLSTRPSRLLSLSSTIKDPEISSLSQLSVNSVVRGFIKNITDHGVYVSLARNIAALVRVSDLSDLFIKDWKAQFKVNQLVEGKVTSLDLKHQHVQMSLKKSLLSKDYKPPMTFADVNVGQIVAGKVRKVEDFGVFVVLDDSANVSGLCHRSEMAEEPVRNVKALYNEGDRVQAKVLKIDFEQRRISLGLKTIYFEQEHAGLQSTEERPDLHGTLINTSDEKVMEDYNMDYSTIKDIDIDGEPDDNSRIENKNLAEQQDPINGLVAGAFDWTGGIPNDKPGQYPVIVGQGESLMKRKHKKAQITVDETGSLDANGPQFADDFERQLMELPNSSYLWISYMAFYLQLSDVSKARDIAKRAIKTIDHQSTDNEFEALNVWVAFLNLENTNGSKDSLNKVFEEACLFNDAEKVHNHLTSIYIQSSKNKEADEILQEMVRKFSQNPKVWLNYATFLFETANEPQRGRELLGRALQSLPTFQHVDITSKFAQLEFRSSRGDAERGRTLFEGLFSNFPKRVDLWSVLLDLETKLGDQGQIRRLFTRVTSGKLKAKQATYFFTRWLAFEEKSGDTKSYEKVKAKEAEYMRTQQGNMLSSGK